jgi:hypothetical protein
MLNNLDRCIKILSALLLLDLDEDTVEAEAGVTVADADATVTVAVDSFCCVNPLFAAATFAACGEDTSSGGALCSVSDMMDGTTNT